MDFLDPKKQKAHLVRLAIGYVLIGTALILTTVILLYRAYGFGIQNGEVIQNGLIFVSSRPNPADLYVNGQRHDETTNARLLMPAGQYTFELQRDGYRPWKRAINVEGGAVVRFDYPVLFPSKLTTTATKQYDVRPALATQSPDRRWLLVQGAAAHNVFDLYDLDLDEVVPETFTLAENLLTLSEGTHQWQMVEWSNDNRHVLLKHSTTYEGQLAVEYVLADRENPAESVNLTQTLGAGAAELSLRDQKHDQYYVFAKQDGRLSKASLEESEPKLFLERVLDFKTHGSDVVLYATDQGADAGKAAIALREDDRTYTLRQVTAGEHYVLDVARYENAWYVAAGAPSENRIYVYKNPVGVLRGDSKATLVPVQVLKAANATHVSFSDNARFIMAQGGQQFAIYDAETDRGYAYTMDGPMDAGQEHAAWMDGHRMMYVSNGKTLVFDFDHANEELLAAADAAYLPFFDGEYRNLYTFNTQTIRGDDGKEASKLLLNRTDLLTPQDQ